MDFNYGNTSNVLSHRLYKTISDADGTPFTNSDTGNAVYNYVQMDVNDLPAATYYWSTVARNDYTGTRSGSSSPVSWGGANVIPYDPMSNTGGIAGNQVQYNTIVNNNVANSTLTGGKIADNTLTFNLFDTNLNVAELLGSSIFNIIDGAGGTLPIDVTSRANFNVPFYINGTNPGANYYSPWYQGTSTTANGYFDNSTGSFQPEDAAYWDRSDGDWDWYVITDAVLTAAIPPPTGIKFTVLVTMVSNVDANVQFATVVGNNVFSTGYGGNDDSLTTINLKANQSYVWETVKTTFASANIDYAGIMMRNMTANANVTIVACQLGLFKSNL
jgi:hypothetical protein